MPAPVETTIRAPIVPAVTIEAARFFLVRRLPRPRRLATDPALAAGEALIAGSLRRLGC